MVNYTNIEWTNIVLCYGTAGENAQHRVLYQQRFRIGLFHTNKRSKFVYFNFQCNLIILVLIMFYLKFVCVNFQSNLIILCALMFSVIEQFVFLCIYNWIISCRFGNAAIEYVVNTKRGAELGGIRWVKNYDFFVGILKFKT